VHGDPRTVARPGDERLVLLKCADLLALASVRAFHMGQRSAYVSIRKWPDRLAEWLQDRGYLQASN
jgi:hypothetical protein